MTFPLRFTIEGPPVGQARPRRSPGGQWYIPKKTRDYAQRVAMSYLRAFRQKLDPPAVSVHVHCVFAGRRHPDPDNVQKLVLDAMQGLAYRNDRAVASSNSFGFDQAHPRVEITLR